MSDQVIIWSLACAMVWIVRGFFRKTSVRLHVYEDMRRDRDLWQQQCERERVTAAERINRKRYCPRCGQEVP